MSDKFDSPRRKPYASGSDTLLHTGEYHGRSLTKPPSKKPGKALKTPKTSSCQNLSPDFAMRGWGWGSVVNSCTFKPLSGEKCKKKKVVHITHCR